MPRQSISLPAYQGLSTYPMKNLQDKREYHPAPTPVPYPPPPQPPLDFYKPKDTRPWQKYFFILLALFVIGMVVLSAVWAAAMTKLNQKMAEAKEIADSAHNITTTETATISLTSTLLSTITNTQSTTLITTQFSVSTLTDLQLPRIIVEEVTVIETSTMMLSTTVMATSMLECMQ